MLDQEQLADFLTVGEPIVLAALATALLARDDSVDETCHHVELRPVDLARVVVVVVRVSFVGTNKIREVDLPANQTSDTSVQFNDFVTHSAGMHAPFVFLRAIRYFW